MPPMVSKQHISFASAPTSPTTTRRHSHHAGPLPVTPQRVTRSAPRAQYRSPLTPATNASTPYTPLSLRSLSSNGSTLTTPVSATSRHMSLCLSPEVGLDVKTENRKHYASIAHNWRNRANENGIKVTSKQESPYADDEASKFSRSNITSPVLVPNESLFVPLPLPTQSRARALSYAPPPRSPRSSMPTQLCTPNRQSILNLNTPPPNASIISKLKIKGSLTDPPAPRRRHAPQPVTSELFDIDEDEYTPYPQAFSVMHQNDYPVMLNDPFNAPDLTTTTDFAYNNCGNHANKRDKMGCSICGLQNTKTLAILEPCSHPLCSACLTSALNIVGEKDMECAVCKAGVDNFHLKSLSENSLYHSAPPTSRSNTETPSVLLPSAFDNNPFIVQSPLMFERAQRTSTPLMDDSSVAKRKDAPVLRIDNVPWDITPPVLTAWLRHPVHRVHVLLDRKGKTLSHVFVEMAGDDAAKAALRTAQNSVLGKGKRARGVTVTRSSQEELMKALFPCWQGSFDKSRPSLAGLRNEQLVAALQAGLISEGELHSLLHLIRSPDSHFLKVPSLPYYSLVSLLSKFPADVDSRVFWSSSLRDFLYDITYIAVETLLSREVSQDGLDDPNLLSQLIDAGTHCRAFTDQQLGKLAELVEGRVHQTIPSSVNTSHCDLRSSPGSSPGRRTSSSVGRIIYGHTPDEREIEDLAREFGIGSDLVEALAQRLSAMC